MREKKEINIQVGKGIRAARERAGLTQEQFGELVSLGPKNVSDIERGIAGIKLSTLKRICEKLSVSSDQILFGSCPENDVDQLANRLKRLTPQQYAAVEDFLYHVFELYGRLDD
ncbi:MAG: helix-turn-helix domain-containing protein [Butyricicoccaceae bacterium]